MKRNKAQSKKGPRLVRGLRRQPLVNVFLQALAAMYPKDKLTAGITLAWLPDKQKFYGSVCRYPAEAFQRPPYREVIVTVLADSPEKVMQELAKGWHGKTQPLLDFNVRMQAQLRRVK